MATTILQFTAAAAEFPTTSGAEYTVQNGELLVAFDGGSAESCIFSAVVPQAYAAGTLTAYLYYRMATDTSGDIDWDVAVEASTDADTTLGSDSFDAANSTDNTTVPATTGTLDVVAVTLTNDDSVAAGDMIRLKVTRQAADDTATGDAYLYRIEVRE